MTKLRLKKIKRVSSIPRYTCGLHVFCTLKSEVGNAWVILSCSEFLLARNSMIEEYPTIVFEPIHYSASGPG